jgi:DNA-binding transcriptional ArsR family regulator
MSETYDDERLDLIFGALSDATRRGMLRRLAEGPASVKELAAPFPISMPAISRHVKVLERAGLLQRSKDGRLHRCTMNREGFDDAHAFLRDMRVFWESNLDQLAAFLETDDG